MIPLSHPYISGNEWHYVKRCLDSGWVSSAGQFVSQFENAIAHYTGAKHAIACVNGTAGLHVALILAGVKSRDYVLVPNLTFVATVNAVKYCGADPILIDVDNQNWQLDLKLLEEFLATQTENQDGRAVLKSDCRPIRAVVPVHVLGNVGDMNELLRIANQYGVEIVEDACEALGSFYEGKHCGTFGKLGVFSFNGNKIVSTGGGGMIVTSDLDLANRAEHLTTQAKVSTSTYEHDEIGYNYRLVNVLAAIGMAQMEQLPQILQNNKRREEYYRSELQKIDDIEFQKISNDVNPNCWLFTFRCANTKELLAHLEENGIQARPFWRPMNQLPMFAENIYYKQHDVSDDIFNSALSIPSSGGITDSELEQVVASVHQFFNKRRKPNLGLQKLSEGPIKSSSSQPKQNQWKVQLFQLNYDEQEAQAAQRVIDSRWITMGEQIRRFESEFAKLLQNRVECMAVSSCTAALHTALLALGIGSGDEVVIPALTFVADANVVRLVGATPVPADSKSFDHWNVSAETIKQRITEKTKAVMIVHYAGYPCDMDDIVNLCRLHGVALIEDVAHAPGALYKNQACGTFGDFGCFSFFTNKNLSIGEGGMLSTNNPELLEKAGFFRSQGMTSLTLDRYKGRVNKYDVATPGLNYRMDEMRAAIGLVQLQKLRDGNQLRRELVRNFDTALSEEKGLRLPFRNEPDSVSSYHIYPILLSEDINRDQFIAHMKNRGIQTSIHYLSFRDFTAYKDAKFPPTKVADEISNRVVTLPLYPQMTAAECNLVVSAVRESLSAANVWVD